VGEERELAALPSTLDGSLLPLVNPEGSVGGDAFMAHADRFLAEARYGALGARRFATIAMQEHQLRYNHQLAHQFITYPPADHL
jgi:hypothetical protein